MPAALLRVGDDSLLVVGGGPAAGGLLIDRRAGAPGLLIEKVEGWCVSQRGVAHGGGLAWFGLIDGQVGSIASKQEGIANNKFWNDDAHVSDDEAVPSC